LSPAAGDRARLSASGTRVLCVCVLTFPIFTGVLDAEEGQIHVALD
jgi:hypothetical protein